jgi:hypothetical protein
MSLVAKDFSIEEALKKLGEQFSIIRRQTSFTTGIIAGIDWGIERDKKKRIIFEE